jgi:carboxyl-terminal processing protease
MLYRILLWVSLSIATTGFAQEPVEFRKEALQLIKSLQQHHIQPKAVDDRLSSQIFNHFLKSLDPNRLYFTAIDVQILLPYQHRLDDELSGAGWAFLQQAMPTYKRSLERAVQTITEIGNAPMAPNTVEYFRPDTTRWPVSDQELKNKWRIWLKHETFNRLSELPIAMRAEKDFFRRDEPEARARTVAAEQRRINRQLNHPSGFENYVVAQYLKSVAAVFDPHSLYMSPTDMENFLSSLSTEGYYFGITLGENERGDVVISALVPGGPAWRTGEIHTSDVLVNLGWEGQENKEGVISLEEANAILSDANHQAIEFTVRKAGGTITKVTMRKEKMRNDDNIVRSFMLTGAAKIGYISLPDFYTRWGDGLNGARCANDVAKEILKLKKENIDGLILDIRYNGGGSLEEAVALAGIFIDEGPLGSLADRTGQAALLKDFNRGTVYDGPLVVMVNGQSASASEFLAGVLQDYRRGLIVGSRTFGKATAQQLFPLDPTQKSPTLESIRRGSGYTTITQGKFYRVNGMSAQETGVIPDIYLPDLAESIGYYESSLPYVLKADSTSKRPNFKQLSGLPVAELAERSRKRLVASSAFGQVAEGCVYLKSLLAGRSESVLLSWSEFDATARTQSQALAGFQESMTTTSGACSISNNQTDLQRLAIDEYARALNARWFQNLQSDIYIEEAFLILCDAVSLSKQK